MKKREPGKSADLGIGVGYRPAFADAFFVESPPSSVSWIEVITENYLPLKGEDTLPIQELRRLREDFPVALHGVSLSLGSCDPINTAYLERLSWLNREIEPWLVSDHLCWTGAGEENLHDLLPLPFHAESLELVAGKIQRVQDLLRRPLAVENISYYARPAGSAMAEEEFLNELAKRTGCSFLLDINNIYVNSRNLGIDPVAYLARLDLRAVAEIHLAGHSTLPNGLIVDTHGAPVADEVWALYEWVQKRIGLVPTMIERDENIPDWSEMETELGKLARLRAKEGRSESPRLASANA